MKNITFVFLTVGQKVHMDLKARISLLEGHSKCTTLKCPIQRLTGIFIPFISNTTERKCKMFIILYLVALFTISSDSALWFFFSSIAQFLDLRVSKRSVSKLPGSMLGNCLISPERRIRYSRLAETGFLKFRSCFYFSLLLCAIIIKIYSKKKAPPKLLKNINSLKIFNNNKAFRVNSVR